MVKTIRLTIRFTKKRFVMRIIFGDRNRLTNRPRIVHRDSRIACRIVNLQRESYQEYTLENSNHLLAERIEDESYNRFENRTIALSIRNGH